MGNFVSRRATSKHRHAGDAAHTQRVVGDGLVRAHEFVHGVHIFSLLPANQAVAYAKMSHSCSTWRSRLRRRTSSSRSVVLRLI